MTASLKQLLVHLDASGTLAARLAVARAIARHHGAAVQALYAVMPASLEIPFAGEVSPGMAAGLAELDQERRKRTLAAFDAAMGTPGPIADWGEMSELPVIGAFAAQALYADLLVLGQADPEDGAGGLPADFVPSVIVDSGRPAVVVPYTGWKRDVGDNIVIAWKAARESARAVTAALPLLQRASRVRVLSWTQDEPPAITGTHLDLPGFLRLHGVKAEWLHEGGESSALGDVLLSRAFDLDADLLVMGCYGHSRARELVLGGVTRTVLRTMTLPVLMAH